LYNETGATVNWKAPTATEGITGYNVELRTNGVGDWKLVATVPATQFKQQITKNDTTGWVQVQVSTVYSDGEVVAGKVHGLPGSWSQRTTISNLNSPQVIGGYFILNNYCLTNTVKTKST
jgi:hypothetical protein